MAIFMARMAAQAPGCLGWVLYLPEHTVAWQAGATADFSFPHDAREYQPYSRPALTSQEWLQVLLGDKLPIKGCHGICCAKRYL